MYTYFALSGGGRAVKIGKTNNVHRRMQELRRGSSRECLYPADAYSAPGHRPRLQFAVRGNYEAWFHKFWRYYHQVGEWFHFDQALELWIETVTEEHGTNVILSNADRDDCFAIGRGLPGKQEYSPEFGWNLDEGMWANLAVEDAQQAVQDALEEVATAREELARVRAERAALRIYV